MHIVELLSTCMMPLESFLEIDNLPPSKNTPFLEILNDPPIIQIELAITVDDGEPFVKATYRME